MSLHVPPCDHHIQGEFCVTRAAYRQGKEYKAVKVYTVNDESQNLLIHNVPSVGLLNEVGRLAMKYGNIVSIQKLSDYPQKQQFTDVYHVKYKLLGDARQAKKRMDNRSFYGNLLHVCYAPELETVDECRLKLRTRISFVRKRFKSNDMKKQNSTKSDLHSNANATSGKWSNLLPSGSSVVVPK